MDKLDGQMKLSFTSLPTVFGSYRDDGRMINKKLRAVESNLWLRIQKANSVFPDEVVHYHLVHADRDTCLQIQLFSFSTVFCVRMALTSHDADYMLKQGSISASTISTCQRPLFSVVWVKCHSERTIIIKRFHWRKIDFCHEKCDSSKLSFISDKMKLMGDNICDA